MAEWKFVGTRLGVPKPESRETSRSDAIRLGAAVEMTHPWLGAGVARYMKGAAGVMAGDACLLDLYAGTVTRLPATGGVGLVGIALSDCGAGEHGFFQTDGAALVRATGSPAVGGAVYASALGTAGSAVVAGEQILGATYASTLSPTLGGVTQTGKAVVSLAAPFIA